MRIYSDNKEQCRLKKKSSEILSRWSKNFCSTERGWDFYQTEYRICVTIQGNSFYKLAPTFYDLLQ